MNEEQELDYEKTRCVKLLQGTEDGICDERKRRADQKSKGTFFVTGNNG